MSVIATFNGVDEHIHIHVPFFFYYYILFFTTAAYLMWPVAFSACWVNSQQPDSRVLEKKNINKLQSDKNEVDEWKG